MGVGRWQILAGLALFMSGCRIHVDVLSQITAPDIAKPSPSAAPTPLADLTPPVGKVLINSGASLTNQTNVLLSLSASDEGGVTSMRFSNDGTNFSVVESYATSKNWALSTGDGIKTVQVKFKDTAGNWSGAFSAQIQLDTQAPVFTQIVSSQLTTSGAKITWKSSEPSTTTIDYGSTSSYGSSTSDPALVTTHSVALSFLNPGVSYHFRVGGSDAAGNSASSSDQMFTTPSPTPSDPPSAPDTTPPTGTITINNGAAYTTSSSVTLKLSASDAGGVTQMRFSEDGSNFGSAETYAASKAWTLSGNDGVKSVWVQFKDTAGNWSTTAISDSIQLDTHAPTFSAISVSEITTTGAKISWTTNETATTATDYGETISYGTSGSGNNSLATQHNVTLSGLSPSKTYHYRVAGSDAAGNPGHSGDMTFQTLTPTASPSPTSGKKTYKITFADTEAKLSDGGAWTTGSDLYQTVVAQTPGCAYGTQSGHEQKSGCDDPYLGGHYTPCYNDSEAWLSGDFSPNQSVSTVIHRAGNIGSYQEVELLLRWNVYDFKDRYAPAGNPIKDPTNPANYGSLGVTRSHGYEINLAWDGYYSYIGQFLTTSGGIGAGAYPGNGTITVCDGAKFSARVWDTVCPNQKLGNMVELFLTRNKCKPGDSSCTVCNDDGTSAFDLSNKLLEWCETDNPIPSGNPGIGFYRNDDGTHDPKGFCFSSFEAAEL